MDEVMHRNSEGARARRRRTKVKAKAMKQGVEAQAVARYVGFKSLSIFARGFDCSRVFDYHWRF